MASLILQYLSVNAKPRNILILRVAVQLLRLLLFCGPAFVQIRKFYDGWK